MPRTRSTLSRSIARKATSNGAVLAGGDGRVERGASSGGVGGGAGHLDLTRVPRPLHELGRSHRIDEHGHGCGVGVVDGDKVLGGADVEAGERLGPRSPKQVLDTSPSLVDRGRQGRWRVSRQLPTISPESPRRAVTDEGEEPTRGADDDG